MVHGNKYKGSSQMLWGGGWGGAGAERGSQQDLREEREVRPASSASPVPPQLVHDGESEADTTADRMCVEPPHPTLPLPLSIAQPPEH